jgi:phage terminase large subunit-like protein
MVKVRLAFWPAIPRTSVLHTIPRSGLVEWPNGAQALLFNAVEPDQLRGPQFDLAWCDELAKWRYAQETWDQLQFGLRLGIHPRQIVTTTPRPIPVDASSRQ